MASFSHCAIGIRDLDKTLIHTCTPQLRRLRYRVASSVRKIGECEGLAIQAHHFCLNSFKPSNQRMLTNPAATQSARSS